MWLIPVKEVFSKVPHNTSVYISLAGTYSMSMSAREIGKCGLLAEGISTLSKIEMCKDDISRKTPKHGNYSLNES